MEALSAVFRAAHFAAAVAIFGEFVFALFLARPDDPAAVRRVLRVAAWCLGVVLVSGVLWLAVQAASMSGVTMAALDRGALAAVLTETLFGQTWLVRLAVAGVLAGALVFLRRADGRRAGAALGAGTLLSGALLGSLAWTGHAVAENGADRIVHLSADVLHLIAAGAWLGALLPLAGALSHARRAADAAALRSATNATRRFSILGIASVGTLIATGVANAWYTVGTLPALVGTHYGRLLLVKLALIAAMLVLAAINRLRLTPRLGLSEDPAPSEPASAAIGALRRNALAEALLGLAVIGVVAVLGVTVPALHVQIVWPFRYTLDWEASGRIAAVLQLAVVAPLIALALILAGARTRTRALIPAAIAILAAAVVVPAWLLAVRAYPTTYFESPVRYTAASIARGAPLYGRFCASCHGAQGQGDGPAAASLADRPPDLTVHVPQHREGDLFWWIARGIPGTPMPGFGARIEEEGLWDTLNFLRAVADAKLALPMTASAQTGRAVPAPDFAYEIGRGAQGSLRQVRERYDVLLVFYSRPGSLPRLRALSEFGSHFARARVRVLAVPMRDSDAIAPGAAGIDPGLLVEPDARVVSAYRMFEGAAVKAPQHVEFLIDRRGYIRARWVAGQAPNWDSFPYFLRQVQFVERETRVPAVPRHTH